MTEKKEYLFGPVPSRRLGLSLGVDIVPFKTCSLDCVYCQIGETTEKTIERRDYVAVEPVLEELKQRLAQGIQADFITISGSGEPTLNSRLGEFIDRIKQICDIPVAIITNGTLFYREDVRADCVKADLVVPSLDAGGERVFQKINRPHTDISMENLISGLAAFRSQFTGQIWLEVFFIEDFNTSPDQIDKIKDAIDRIKPDKIQINTAVRPTAVSGIKRIEAEKLNEIAAKLGPKCEVVADFSSRNNCQDIENKAENIISMLKRRPCSMEDIASGLGMPRQEALKYITHLQETGVIGSEQKNGILFYKAI